MSIFHKLIDTYKESKRLGYAENDKKRRYELDRQKNEQLENANLRTANAYKTLGVFSEKVIDKFFGIHQEVVNEKDNHHYETSGLYQEIISKQDNHHNETSGLHQKIANEKDNLHSETTVLHQKIANEKDNRHSEATGLYQQIVNVKDNHHSEVTGLYKDGIRFSLSLLKLIFDQKDELLEKTLCIMDEVSRNGENSFNNFEEHTQTIRILDDGIKLLSEHHCTVRDELLILNHDLNNLRAKFNEEEAKYSKIIDLRDDLGIEKYNYQRLRSLLSSLETTDKINKYEISLMEKEHDKACIEEKLLFVKHIRETIEHKKYRELYAIKNSLSTAKTFAQTALPYQNDIVHKQLPLLSKEVNSELEDRRTET